MRKRLAHRIPNAHQRAAQLRLIVEQAPAIIWTTDADLRIASCWGAPLRALSLTPNEVVGTTLYEYFKTEDPSAPYIANHLQALQGTLVSFDADYKGRAFRIRLEPLRDSQSRIIGAVGVALDVTEQRRSEESIRYLASHDPLTGLANYRALLEAFDKELQRSDRTARPFAVLLLDMDRLKEINDRHGHLVGTRALGRLAAVLQRTCRSTDAVARYGGDEFGLLLVETDQAAALQVAHRIENNLANDCENPPLTVSVGIAVYPGDGYTFENLLAAADRDLYRNKLRNALHVKACAAQTDSRGVVQTECRPERRRSERVLLDVPLLVCGQSTERQPFQEETFTISVSAHGALLILATKVALGQKLVLRNQQTQDERHGTVACFGSPYGGLAQVAIEFSRPAPEFWPVDPLPRGWRISMQTDAAADKQLSSQ